MGPRTDLRQGSSARGRWYLRRCSLAVTAAVVAGLIGGSDRASAAADMPSQQEVEAVYLFDFGKFVRWPAPGTQGSMRICVAAAPSFSTSMEKTVSGEQIDGRSLEVRHVSRPDEADACAILFIDATQRANEQELLQAVEGKPTLTVSDAPGFLERGGMVQFQMVHSRVRFAVNLTAVNHASLSMSSELLKVAIRVQGSASAGGAQ